MHGMGIERGVQAFLIATRVYEVLELFRSRF
jgi:hypothetical protein